MILYNEDEFYELKTIIAKCDCGGHQIEIIKLSDEDYYYLHVNMVQTFKQRLKALFKSNVQEEIIIKKHNFDKFVKALSEVSK